MLHWSKTRTHYISPIVPLEVVTLILHSAQKGASEGSGRCGGKGARKFEQCLHFPPRPWRGGDSVEVTRHPLFHASAVQRRRADLPAPPGPVISTI